MQRIRLQNPDLQNSGSPTASCIPYSAFSPKTLTKLMRSVLQDTSSGKLGHYPTPLAYFAPVSR